MRRHEYVRLWPFTPWRCIHCGNVTRLSEWQLRELLSPRLWRCRAATAPKAGMFWWLPAGVDTIERTAR